MCVCVCVCECVLQSYVCVKVSLPPLIYLTTKAVRKLERNVCTQATSSICSAITDHFCHISISRSYRSQAINTPTREFEEVFCLPRTGMQVL